MASTAAYHSSCVTVLVFQGPSFVLTFSDTSHSAGIEASDGETKL